MNALLSWAALIDGLEVLSYDQTGAAQKWGPVLSSLILARPDQEFAANKVGLGRADLYLALDLLGGRDAREPRPLRPRAHGGGGERVRPAERGDGARRDFAPAVAAIRAPDRSLHAGHRQRGRRRAGAGRRPLRRLHGHQHAGLGVAYQAGLLPLTAAAVEQAIELNGVRWSRTGRLPLRALWVADPERVRALVEPPARSFETERAPRSSGSPARTRARTCRCSTAARTSIADARRMLATASGS
jgi:indolepyruvate ferredoxin oxidoreductase